jgi:16S rRNA (cytosine1402-N4)-methyltransferase
VLLAETLRYLGGREGLLLDATLGDAGHAEALLSTDARARLLGCDRDPDAIEIARERLRRFGDRVMLARATFRDLPAVHRGHGGEPLAGALLDLGVSSRQIDDPARGMSFMLEGPLDLRMDRTTGAPAFERLATVEAAELERVLAEHGDVPRARALARDIAAAARAGRIDTTRALVALIERSHGGRVHPRRLAQVFQALRIWINQEAEDLDFVLVWLPEVTAPGGVVVTLAYHSGEDRKIKRMLRGPQEFRPARRIPYTPSSRPPERPWEELTAKVVVPSPEEVSRNPRARSARLRAFRRKPHVREA